MRSPAVALAALPARKRRDGVASSGETTMAVARDWRRVVADLVALTKPRVVLMVLVTTAVGYRAGLAGPAGWTHVLALLIGTMLAAGGTLALNQYWEREVDARMARTRARPLPAGRLRPSEVLAFGTVISVAGVLYLALAVNWLSSLVTAVIVVVYVFAYTPLKLRTPLCTLVGAVPGALPPVTGWVAARDDLGTGAWVLFGILFFWQLPHALAIARLHMQDYARAGIRLSPVIDPDGASTERQILLASVALLLVSPLATLAGIGGTLYLVTAVALGAGFATFGALQALAPSPAAARRVLFASLAYLPVLLAVLAFDKP